MFACQEKPFLLGIAWEKSIATGRLESLVTIRERAITGGPLTAF